MQEERHEVTQLVQQLLTIGALRFDFSKPFTYASGLKGPIYCDNRKILGHPQLRQAFVQHLHALVASDKGQYDAVAGLATAGIPHAAWLADVLQLPMMYIRSKAKEYGKGQQVEGDPRPGQRLLLVEDLVNQASSLDTAYHAALEEKLRPQSVVCLVSYDMAAAVKRLHQWALPLKAVIHYHDLRYSLLALKHLSQAQVELLDQWHNSPETWSI
jgi:orotate phosphoribosyltransferase